MFEGKVVVVTGAGSGIGRACALAFAAQGAKVIVADIAVADGEETVGLIKTAGGNSTFVPCNVARSADVSSLMAESVRTYGRLDYACNNARVGGPPKITDDYSEADWRAVIHVNLTGAFTVAEAMPDGDKVRVQLVSVDVQQGFINFKKVGWLKY